MRVRISLRQSSPILMWESSHQSTSKSEANLSCLRKGLVNFSFRRLSSCAQLRKILVKRLGLFMAVPLPVPQLRRCPEESLRDTQEERKGFLTIF